MKKEEFIKIPKAAGEQTRTGADEIANKFIDFLLKELEELKEENKELKRMNNFLLEENKKEFVEKYGYYPGNPETNEP